MNPEEGNLYRPDSSSTATAVAEPPPAPVAQAPPAPAPQAPPDSPPAIPPAGGSTVTWTTAEYYHHERGSGWYALLFIAIIALTGVVYLLTKDYFASGTILVVGAIVGVFAARKPGQVNCELSNTGLRIGEKMYNYTQFKSFSIIRAAESGSLSLLPIKKFMPAVNVYFGPADEEKITDVLGQHLPYEERQQAGIDRLSHRLKF